MSWGGGCGCVGEAVWFSTSVGGGVGGGGEGAVDQKSSLHEAEKRSYSPSLLPFSSPSPSAAAVLLRRLRRRALGLAVLTGGGFAAPGGAVAQSRGAVEVVLVVQAVGGVVLRVLQAGDQTLVLVPELAAHQGRLAHHHHVLSRQIKGRLGAATCVHVACGESHAAFAQLEIRTE